MTCGRQILADAAAAYLFNAQTRHDLSATVRKLNHLTCTIR